MKSSLSLSAVGEGSVSHSSGVSEGRSGGSSKSSSSSGSHKGGSSGSSCSDGGSSGSSSGGSSGSSRGSSTSKSVGSEWPSQCSGSEWEAFLDQWEERHFSEPSVTGAHLDFDASVIESDMSWLHQRAGSKHDSVCALIRRRQAQVEGAYLNVDSIKGFEGFPQYTSLYELATVGAQPWISPDFVPNRGVGTKPRSQYRQLRPAIHHQLAKLQAAGLALVLPKGFLVGTEGLHLNQPLVVMKEGDTKGRVCVDENASGLNDSTMLEELYERDGDLVLPGLKQFAGMVHSSVTNHNAKVMYKLDVSGAFGRFRYSPEAALLQAVEVGDYVVIMLNGCFGWTAAPKCYSIVSDAIAWAHNGGIHSDVCAGWADAQSASEATGGAPLYAPASVVPLSSKSSDVGRLRSVTYVDDSVGASSNKSVVSDMSVLIAIVKKLLGMLAINDSKTEGPSRQLTAIGWYFDLQRMTVRPGDKGIQKMCVWLFRRLQGPECSVKNLRSVLGLLRWYSAVIPHGSSQLVHLSDLVVWGVRSRKVKVAVNNKVRGELEWWCSILREGFAEPNVWESSIASLACPVVRSVVVDSVEMFTDASTKVGGGFVVKELGVFGEFVWSEWEKKFFAGCKASAESDAGINVLEFVTVVIAIVACKEELRGKVVRVRVDNTSAVAWLVKQKSPNMLCVEWLRLLLSVLLSHNIQIAVSHIPGKDNITADALSRQLLDMANQLRAKGAHSKPVLDAGSRKKKWQVSGRDVF